MTSKWGHESRSAKRAARRTELTGDPKRKRAPKSDVPAPLRENEGAFLLREPNPRAVADYLLHHGAQIFCDQLIEGLKRNSRTAMNLFPRVTRMLGVDNELVLAMMIRMGFQNEQEARTAARMQQAVSNLNDRDREGLALKTLQSAMRRDPEARERIRRVLFADAVVVDPAMEVKP